MDGSVDDPPEGLTTTRRRNSKYPKNNDKSVGRKEHKGSAMNTPTPRRRSDQIQQDRETQMEKGDKPSQRSSRPAKRSSSSSRTSALSEEASITVHGETNHETNSSSIVRCSISPSRKREKESGSSRQRPSPKSYSEAPVNVTNTNNHPHGTTQQRRPTHSQQQRRKRETCRPRESSYNESTTTFTSKSTLSRSVTIPVVNAQNNSQLKFDVDVPRDAIGAMIEDGVGTVTSSISSIHDDHAMSLEQKAWAGIASILRQSDASVNSSSAASSAQVLPQHIMSALRGLKRSGSIGKRHVPNFALDNGDEDDDEYDDQESKAVGSLSSSMPSLGNMSFASLATEIITALPNQVAHNIVQTRSRQDTLQAFCNHLLSVVKPVDAISVFGKHNNPDPAHAKSRDQQSMHNSDATSVHSAQVMREYAGPAVSSQKSLKRCESVASPKVHHIPTFGFDNIDDYANDEDEDDNDFKTADSLQSSMPSLCNASLASVATEIINAYPNEMARIIIQSRAQDDALKVFCDHLLSVVKPTDAADSVGSSHIPETTSGELRDQPEMLSYLHRILNAPSSDNQMKTYSEGATTKSSMQQSVEKPLDDSMQSLLNDISEIEVSDGIDQILTDSSPQLSQNKQYDGPNSSMPSLLSCKTGDMDLYASQATKWASCGDLHHISEDESSSDENESCSSSRASDDGSENDDYSASEEIEATQAKDGHLDSIRLPAIPKLPMGRSKTVNSSPLPPVGKPLIRRAKTESSHMLKTNHHVEMFDRNATPDTTFEDFIPSDICKGPNPIQHSERRKVSFMTLFPGLGRPSNQANQNTRVTVKSKVPVLTFRERVSLLKFRGNPESKANRRMTKTKKGRSEAKFFPRDDKSDEFVGDFLLP